MVFCVCDYDVCVCGCMLLQLPRVLGCVCWHGVMISIACLCVVCAVTICVVGDLSSPFIICVFDDGVCCDAMMIVIDAGSFRVI